MGTVALADDLLGQAGLIDQRGQVIDVLVSQKLGIARVWIVRMYESDLPPPPLTCGFGSEDQSSSALQQVREVMLCPRGDLHTNYTPLSSRRHLMELRNGAMARSAGPSPSTPSDASGRGSTVSHHIV